MDCEHEATTGFESCLKEQINLPGKIILDRFFIGEIFDKTIKIFANMVFGSDDVGLRGRES